MVPLPFAPETLEVIGITANAVGLGLAIVIILAALADFLIRWIGSL